MAISNPVKISGRQLTTPEYGKEIYSWGPFAAGDTFDAVGPNKQDGLASNVQFIGAVYGGTVSFEGSNDGVNFFPLSDPRGNLIQATQGGTAFELSTACAVVRPKVGVGVAGATVILCMRAD